MLGIVRQIVRIVKLIGRVIDPGPVPTPTPPAPIPGPMPGESSLGQIVLVTFAQAVAMGVGNACVEGGVNFVRGLVGGNDKSETVENDGGVVDDGDSTGPEYIPINPEHDAEVDAIAAKVAQRTCRKKL